MEVVRNSINIAGLADENTLPDSIHGQMIQCSEADTIKIDDNQPEISSIYQVILKLNVKESRYIKTPVGNTMILDGRKMIKIVYTQKSESGKANFIELSLPFNAFVEVPDNTKIENVNVYILDAFFDLLDERRIYSHIVYLIDVMTVDSKPVEHRKLNDIEVPISKFISNISDADKYVENTNYNEREYVVVDLEEEYL